MKLKVFSVFDTKMAQFGSPFYDQRTAAAIRAFTDAVNSSDPNNGFAKHPEDYSLYLLAEFDNETGAFDLLKPTNLVTAASLRSPLSQNSNGNQPELAIN